MRRRSLTNPTPQMWNSVGCSGRRFPAFFPTHSSRVRARNKTFELPSSRHPSAPLRSRLPSLRNAWRGGQAHAQQTAISKSDVRREPATGKRHARDHVHAFVSYIRTFVHDSRGATGAGANFHSDAQLHRRTRWRESPRRPDHRCGGKFLWNDAVRRCTAALGTVFKLSHKGSAWVFTPLYGFSRGRVTGLIPEPGWSSDLMAVCTARPLLEGDSMLRQAAARFST